MIKSKAPTSWVIWMMLWIFPMLIAIGKFQSDPISAIATWVGGGVLITLMLFKTKWVIYCFGIILILDLIGYGMVLSQPGTNVGFIIGALTKELVFLGYLLFSKNAKRHQGRLQNEEAYTEQA